MSDLDAILDIITPEIYQNLKRSIELGKWPDGRVLSREQREMSMQAVIAWETRNEVPADQRTGYIDRGSKAEGELCDDDEPAVIRIVKNNMGIE